MAYLIDNPLRRKLDKRLFKGASAPPAPDPYATADAQGKANDSSARLSATLSRYDQVTPYGTTRWSQDPNNTDKWTSSFELDPQLKAMLGQYQNAASQPLQTVNTTGLQNVATGHDYRVNADSNYDFGANSASIGQSSQLAGQAGNLASKQMSQLGGVLSKQLDYSGAPAMPTADEATRKAVEDAYYQRQTSRLDPQYGQAEADLRTRLANEGLTPGSEAYNREIEQFGRAKNDAYAGARNDATTNSTSELAKLFGMGLSARQQGVAEANYLRDQPLKEAQALAGLRSGYASDLDRALSTQAQLRSTASASAANALNMDSSLRANGLNERMLLNNQQTQQRNQLLNELMALTTGSQIQGGGAGQIDVAAAPIAQSIYNTYQGQLQAAANKNQANTAMWTGLGQMASSAAMAYAASDLRTKQNVVRIGDHSPGIGIYSFEYKPEFADEWGHGRKLGVLAHEVEKVKPEAVATHPDGYKMVDYIALEK